MYVPQHFQPNDQAAAFQLMDEFPFATLIATAADGCPFVSHVPLLVRQRSDGKAELTGHMARANPQWRIFEQRPNALAIFHGPHTYITPRWYAEHDVPTWNYAVVHGSGPVELLAGERETVAVIAALAARFEGTGPEAWRYSLPDDLAAPGALTSAIVAFRIVADQVTGKFKLSQNRSATDRARVAEGLAERGDEQSLGVRSLMLR